MLDAKKIEYLRSTNPRKIQVVQEWPIPKNVKQLNGFLGLTGYYRRFVRGYGVLAKPLTNLLKGGAYQWTSEAENAFQQLKKPSSQRRFWLCPI